MGRNKSNENEETINLITFYDLGCSIIKEKLNIFEKFIIIISFLLFLTTFLLHSLDYEYTQNSLPGEQINEIGIILNFFCFLCSLIIVIKNKLLGFFLIFFTTPIYIFLNGYAYIGE